MVEVSQLANIAANAAAPVMGQTLVLGTVEYVLLEAAVSMLLRRVIKAQRRPFLQEVALHTIAMPFVGGRGALQRARKGYLTRRRRGVEGGESSSLTGVTAPSA